MKRVSWVNNSYTYEIWGRQEIASYQLIRPLSLYEVTVADIDENDNLLIWVKETDEGYRYIREHCLYRSNDLHMQAREYIDFRVESRHAFDSYMAGDISYEDFIDVISKPAFFVASEWRVEEGFSTELIMELWSPIHHA